MGNNRYKLIDLDNEDAVIDAAAAVDASSVEWYHVRNGSPFYADRTTSQ